PRGNHPSCRQYVRFFGGNGLPDAGATAGGIVFTPPTGEDTGIFSIEKNDTLRSKAYHFF
ncbi:MAG: hypothetical protein AABX02_01220, partial [archaeon]